MNECIDNRNFFTIEAKRTTLSLTLLGQNKKEVSLFQTFQDPSGTIGLDSSFEKKRYETKTMLRYFLDSFLNYETNIENECIRS